MLYHEHMLFSRDDINLDMINVVVISQMFYYRTCIVQSLFIGIPLLHVNTNARTHAHIHTHTLTSIHIHRQTLIHATPVSMINKTEKYFMQSPKTKLMSFGIIIYKNMRYAK